MPRIRRSLRTTVAEVVAAGSRRRRASAWTGSCIARALVLASRRRTLRPLARGGGRGIHPSEGGPRGLPGRGVLAIAVRRSVMGLGGGAGSSAALGVALTGGTGGASTSSESAGEDAIVASGRRPTSTRTLPSSPVWSLREPPLGVGMPPIAHKRTINTVIACRHASIAPKLSSARLRFQPAGWDWRGCGGSTGGTSLVVGRPRRRPASDRSTDPRSRETPPERPTTRSSRTRSSSCRATGFTKWQCNRPRANRDRSPL
jgi:hypothetical protein